MSEQKWTRDKTPYLVFPCKRCHQYSYVKLTQKTKKCLRCGHNHSLNSIIPTGQVVQGMTKALELVKKRQGSMNDSPQFKANNSFTLSTNGRDKDLNYTKKQRDEDSWFECVEEDNYRDLFKEILKRLTAMYQTFPKYMIEIMAEEYSIPRQKIPELLRAMINQGILRYSKDKEHYFLLNSRKTS